MNSVGRKTLIVILVTATIELLTGCIAFGLGLQDWKWIPYAPLLIGPVGGLAILKYLDWKFLVPVLFTTIIVLFIVLEMTIASSHHA